MTAEQVIEVVKLVNEGHSRPHVSSLTGIPVGNIHDIMQGRAWNHVTGIAPYAPTKSIFVP